VKIARTLVDLLEDFSVQEALAKLAPETFAPFLDELRVGSLRAAIGALLDEPAPRKRGRPRKTPAEPAPPTPSEGLLEYGRTVATWTRAEVEAERDSVNASLHGPLAPEEWTRLDGQAAILRDRLKVLDERDLHERRTRKPPKPATADSVDGNGVDTAPPPKPRRKRSPKSKTAGRTPPPAAPPESESPLARFDECSAETPEAAIENARAATDAIRALPDDVLAAEYAARQGRGVNSEWQDRLLLVLETEIDRRAERGAASA